MSRKEDIEKLNDLVAEVNALVEKIRNDYAKEQEDDVLAEYIFGVRNNAKSDLYHLNSDSDVVSPYRDCSDMDFSEYDNPYHIYLSEEYANKAAKMKKFNDMLLAFKWCYDRTYEPDWSDGDSPKYFIYYDTDVSTYIAEFACIFAKNDVYFHTRIAAEDCANWLNKVDPKGELVK